ncbi:GNAT family N-acetyltransferase [Poritiphilus flavus]|uniref:GNAT family N-acetyltransferase n=1 Tax=Poritiphilus flavus TaxID=2697053 RepID=A0A6L9EHF1_9FLAO|nr:GNAT family N-acetyltransferase [Poritiphilus flavus]NAS14072.1 GNAT family N-acetyltransferase [Poritiphilus flavus]
MGEIVKVIDQGEISRTVELASKIWNDHYVPIIGQQQVDYMLEKFQSEPAIKEQINSGYEYFLLRDHGKELGYLGLIPDHPKGKLMISKIYLDKSARGGGYGGQLLSFTQNLATHRQFSAIWLTVNRHNKNTIAWYEKKGFVKTQEIKQDIGNGYFMDDYVMEMSLPSDTD